MFTTKIRFIVLLLLMAFMGGVFIHASLTEEDKQQKEFETYYKIYSLAAPHKLVFAGEVVPLNDFDIQERYDREILTNVYWQSQTLLMIKRAYKYFPLVEQILAQQGIPDDMKYLALAESGLQNVVSPAGAAGYWQMLDGTAKNFGLEINTEVDERYHIEKSTQAACRYFKEAYAVFNSWALVAASYNMGIDGLRKQLQQQGVNNYYDLLLNTETSRYVFRTLAIKEIMERPSNYGFNVINAHKYQQIPTVKVKVTRSITDLTKYSLDNGCNYKLLKVLNPWLKSKSLTVPAGKIYYIELPKYKIVATDLADKLINDTIEVNNTHIAVGAE
jgi:membrane-bound lytic murein transglycosylase D